MSSNLPAELPKIVVDDYTVDDLLDNVDYSFPGYTPSVDAFRFINFMRLVLGEEPENSNPLAHYFLMDVIFKHVDPFEYYGFQSDVARDNFIAVMCHREFSKSNRISQNIMTPHGWITMGELQVGMEVINRYGKPTKVTHKSEAMFPKEYRITLTDGSSHVVGEDHLNIVWMESRRPDERRPEKVLTTRELLDGPPLFRTIDRKGDNRNPKVAYKYGIPLVDPIEFEEATNLALPPYVMGYGLANGAFKSGEISCHIDDAEEIVGYYNNEGFTKHWDRQPAGTKAYAFKCNNTNIYAHYKYVGTSRSKFIPEEYLLGSIEQRLELLRGLMDGDGTTGQSHGVKRQSRSHTYDTFSKSLAEDVEQLVRSLGGISYIREYKRDEDTTAYNVVVNMPKHNPYKLKRKADQWKPSKKILRSIVSIEEEFSGEEHRCINVESDCHSYISGDGMIVTHNSVLLGTMLCLFMAYEGELPGFGSVNFGGYIGNSVRGGVRQNMQTIAGVYKDSVYLQDKFESTHFTDSAVKFIRHPKKNSKGVITKKEAKEGTRTFVMEGYGAQSGPRGSRDGLVRPQFFIIDDVIKNAADSRSDVILGNIDRMIDEDIGYALSGVRHLCIYIGTPFNLRDPLMKSLVDGTWMPVVFPIAEDIRLGITKKEFHGSWEDRHSYEKVMIKYRTAVHKGKLASFMQEQMLRVASEEDRMITNDMLDNWFKRSYVTKYGHLYNWYITTDFTTTGSRSSDYSTMAVWAVNNNGEYMLCDLVVQKLELNEQYMKLMALAKRYKKMQGYIEVGIETSGQQKAHIYALKLLMAKHNEYFTIATQKGTTHQGIQRSEKQGNKFEYFMPMVPAFQNNQIHFAEELRDTPDLKELIAELTYVTHIGFGARHDDAIDVVSQLNELNIRIPEYENKALTTHREFDKDGYFHDVDDFIEAEIEPSSYVF